MNIEIEVNEFLVIGLVGAVGSRLKPLSNILKSLLEEKFNYVVEEVRVSDLFLKNKLNAMESNNYKKYKSLMDIGNEQRRLHTNKILSYQIIKHIAEARKSTKRRVFIINSLKHDEEIEMLREVYGKNFYQISLYESPEVREDTLVHELGMSIDQARKLMDRDESEKNDFGQHTRAAFHLADYFIKFDNKNNEQIKKSCLRFLELIFGHPYRTPTFNEYAMYMAFTSSLKSADLSRQVGAVLTNNRNIIATGANDIPKFGGGQYWPEYNSATGEIEDIPSGRDYTLGYDSNETEKNLIVQKLYELITNNFNYLFNDDNPTHLENKKTLKHIIKSSPIKDITEYGRVVHAEMDALISCGRTNNPTINGVMYVTTFPCHNCAKHIIAAGVKEVIFIEPYPKSKALSLWADSIALKGINPVENKVIFSPFVGVGPRSYLDLFSMSQGAGGELMRKNNGKTIEWSALDKNPRMKVHTLSLGEIEHKIIHKLDSLGIL